MSQNSFFGTLTDFSFSSFVRGGLRTLLPSTRLKYRYDLLGALREGYDLAHTQHLKNKDIPEGGAKGLLIVRPGVGKEVCQRIFVRELAGLMSKIVGQTGAST